MKRTNFKLTPYFGMLLIFLFISCNEKEFLEEKALDFFSPSNSYVDIEDFERALVELYSRARYCTYQTHASNGSFVHLTSTDVAKDGRSELSSTDRFGAHSVYLTPTGKYVEDQWSSWYKLIANANTVISRVTATDLKEHDKNKIIGEAKFFRAYGYRYLAYLFGDIPLSLDEITFPKTDFIQVGKEEVLKQMVLDLTDASEVLPEIAETQDGKVSKLVALHLLSETLISLKEYDKAINAATTIIDDPNTALMTERFGSMGNQDPKDEFLKFTQPGDVYWDLFRVNNQNRSSGNKEALWVIQYDIDVPGGALSSLGGWNVTGTKRGETMNILERIAGPVPWLSYEDPDGKEASVGLPMSNYNSGGAGVSLMRNTEWFLNDLWESDWDNDIRNAPHNIVRDHVYTNPESDYYGKSSVEYPSPTWINQNWRWYPYPSKITTPHQHPDELYADKEKNHLISTAGATYRDNYVFRLAETYLLRAESFLGKGDLESAAKDINKVRMRSNAIPITVNDVTLDYILDERARELVYEEPRRITLHRTGKLIERVRKYNELNRDEIEDYHKLWPIPLSFIEANVDAEIKQNPGY